MGTTQQASATFGRVPADLRAVAVQHVDLAGQRIHIAGDVALVRVLGYEPQRPLLAPAADHDLRAAGLYRPGQVAGMIKPVVAASEARVVPREHGPAYLDRLLEHVEADPGSREVDAEPFVLNVVPGAPDAEDGPASRDDVQGRDDLGQDARV